MNQFNVELSAQMEQMETLAIQIAQVIGGYYAEMCKQTGNTEQALTLTLQFQEMWLQRTLWGNTNNPLEEA